MLCTICYQGALAEPVLQTRHRLHCIPCQISRCLVVFGRTVSMTTLYAFCEPWTWYTVAYLCRQNVRGGCGCGSRTLLFYNSTGGGVVGVENHSVTSKHKRGWAW